MYICSFSINRVNTYAFYRTTVLFTQNAYGHTLENCLLSLYTISLFYYSQDENIYTNTLGHHD